MNGDHVNCPLVHKTSTPTFQRRTEEQNKPLLSLFPFEGISFLDKQRLDGERSENILNNALTEKRDTQFLVYKIFVIFWKPRNSCKESSQSKVQKGSFFNPPIKLTKKTSLMPMLVLWCYTLGISSSLPLTRSSLCFPWDHFSITLPSITRAVLSAWQVETVYVLQ